MRAVSSILAASVVLLAAAATASAVSSPSVNDSRASALPLAPDQFSAVDTTGDTIESGEPNTSSGGCQPTGGTTNGALIGATEWYTVIGTGGPITITTDEPTPTTPPESTDTDTLIFVYPHGTSSEDTAIACDDDVGTDLHATVTFSSATGQPYDVQVGGFSSPASGNPPDAGLIVTAERPANDERSFPTPLTVAGGPIAASNFAATTETGETLACQRQDGSLAFYGRTVWFRFHAPGAGVAAFATSGGLGAGGALGTGNDVNTVEAVYAAPSATPIACNDDASAAAPGPSSVTVPVTEGDYLIQVGGLSGAGGSWTESVSFVTQPAITLISSDPRSHVGRQVTFVASLSPVPPSGTVEFADAGAPIDGCDAVRVDAFTGDAQCSVTYGAVGTHSIVATFKVGGSATGAQSSTLTQVVALASTSTSLAVAPRRPIAGRTVTIRARVSPVPVGGTVEILAGRKPLRRCRALTPNPSSGVAVCRTRFRRAGKLALTARFTGSTGYTSSSRKRKLTVRPLARHRSPASQRD